MSTRTISLMRGLAFAAMLVFGQSTIHAQQALAPLQTLNFDFGAGTTYLGDEGPLSSAGGTYWNKVSADPLNNSFGFDAVDVRDEFGQPTDGLLFSAGAIDAEWVDTFTTLPSSPAPPRDDGIRIQRNSQFSENPTVTIGRVQQFEEMVIYVTSPQALSGESAGGFTFGWFDSMVTVPFEPIHSPFNAFPGITTSVVNSDYLRFTTDPPLGGGLGEAPTITLAITDSQAVLHAIQIRGRFKGLPEPSGATLLAILGGSLMVGFRRAL